MCFNISKFIEDILNGGMQKYIRILIKLKHFPIKFMDNITEV